MYNTEIFFESYVQGLVQAIRSAHMTNRQKGIKEDYPNSVRYIFDYCVEKCFQYYSPRKYNIIDKMPDELGERCRFSYYTSNKPAK